MANGMIRALRMWVAVGVAALAVVTRLPAQSTATTGSIAGVARDTARRPLANVDISARPGHGSVHTDAEGRFTIADVRPGEYVLYARAIGYRPVNQTVIVRGGERAEVEIAFA